MPEKNKNIRSDILNVLYLTPILVMMLILFMWQTHLFLDAAFTRYINTIHTP